MDDYENLQRDDTARDAADETPFATWLHDARIRKGWTQIDLAQRAGLSSQQISNLETGRTQNPQEATRKKLERALDAETPTEVVRAEEEQSTVGGLGSLVGFDPYDLDNLPTVCGVYAFYDQTKRPVYVGRATKRPIAARVREHEEKFWFKSPVVESARYLAIDDAELCKQIEQVLIKFMRTHLLINRQGVEREDEEHEV